MPLNFKKRLKGHFLQQKRAKFKFLLFDQDTIIQPTCHGITTALSEMYAVWGKAALPRLASVSSPQRREPLGISLLRLSF